MVERELRGTMVALRTGFDEEGKPLYFSLIVTTTAMDSGPVERLKPYSLRWFTPESEAA